MPLACPVKRIRIPLMPRDSWLRAAPCIALSDAVAATLDAGARGEYVASLLRPGVRPFPEDRLCLVGARDLDPGETLNLDRSKSVGFRSRAAGGSPSCSARWSGRRASRAWRSAPTIRGRTRNAHFPPSITDALAPLLAE